MTVNIKGKDRSIAVNMLCQQAYTEKLDMEAAIVTAIYATVWGVLKGGAYANGEEFDLTFGDVIEWVDIQMEGDQKEVTEICNLWTDSFFYKKWIKAIKEGIDDIEKKSL